MTDNPAARAARANIHPSTLNEMAKVASYNPMEDVGAARFTTGGPCGAIPDDHSKQQAPRNVPSGTGWQHEVPLSNPPGTAICDRLMDAQDAKDRAALVAQAAPKACTTLEQQLLVITKQLEVLMLLRARDEQQVPAKKKQK
jgi:hypothetical protein